MRLIPQKMICMSWAPTLMHAGAANLVTPDGVEVDTWKFRSMSGFIIMRCGGPLAWKYVRQDRFSRSSYRVKLRFGLQMKVQYQRDFTSFLSVLLWGHVPSDAARPTPVYNDNQGCVDWSKTTKSSAWMYLSQSCHSSSSMVNNIIMRRHDASSNESWRQLLALKVWFCRPSYGMVLMCFCVCNRYAKSNKNFLTSSSCLSIQSSSSAVI